MNGLNDTAHFLFSCVIGYHILFTLVLGWHLDIRDAFFELRLIIEFIAFMIFIYGCDKFSPMFIGVSVMTIIIIGFKFYNDPRDTYYGSLHNIFKERSKLGYNMNKY